MIRGRYRRADLHFHSNRSDGRYPPEEVLARAIAGGLDLIALTDHDLPPAWPATQDGVRILAGTELSGVHAGREFHLLVYFPGEMPADFRDFLTSRASSRARRYDEAVALLRQAGLDDLAFADDDAHAGARAMTRQHLCWELIRRGKVKTLSAGYAWMAEHKIVPLIDLSFTEAIRRARAAGGLPIWAHPALADVQAFLSTFAPAGLVGLEINRPTVSRPNRNGLRRLALRYKLLISGGSDWHGWGGGNLGEFSFNGEDLDAFCARLDG